MSVYNLFLFKGFDSLVTTASFEIIHYEKTFYKKHLWLIL